VHDPAGGPEQTALIDLSQQRALGIRRALPPEQVPAESREHLMSRRRSVWFFEATDDAAARDAEDEDEQRAG
jgi:hypothetical protein